MDRIFQWVWDRYGAVYSWAICALVYPPGLSVHLSLHVDHRRLRGIRSLRRGGRRHRVAMLVRVYLLVLPGSKRLRLIEQWAAGNDVDSMAALRATFTYARKTIARALATDVVWAVSSRSLSPRSPGRRVAAGPVRDCRCRIRSGHRGDRYTQLREGSLRPVRAAIAGDTGIGDSLPRSRPTFAAWSNIAMLAMAFAFATAGRDYASVIDRASEDPVVSVVIGCALDAYSGPLTVMTDLAVLAAHSRPRGRNRTCCGRRLQPTPAGCSGRRPGCAVGFVQPYAGGFG